LITALGCGVGEERDMTKLRYHKIVIMTDADVDGSHIRTLLLTFFYRQYPDLIDQGYLYIAQPPLYKVKRGKKETYLKNEGQPEEYLIAAATDDVQVTGAGGKGAVLSGDALSEFVRRALRYNKVLGALDARCDARLVDALVMAANLGKGDLADEAQLRKILDE